MSYGRRRIDFQDLLVTHADKDGFTTIQTTRVDTDFFTGEEPAHGQHFESSLAIPLLLPVDRYKIMGRYIRKGRPGFDVICVFNEPAGYGGFCCLPLHLPGFLRSQPENPCQLGKVRCPPGLHEMLYDSSVSSLHQFVFLHVVPSLLVLVMCTSETTHRVVVYSKVKEGAVGF